MYLKQIEQLVALQKVDTEVLQLQEELQAAPREVEALEVHFQELDGKRTQLGEKIDFLRQQDKRLAAEIEDDNLKIKKSKNKLMMVSNNKEYHAMMREMDNLEKLNRLREEEKLALVEELQRQEATQQIIEEETSKLKADLDQKKANLKQRVDEAEQRLSDLNMRRKEAEKTVPVPVLGRYKFIRARLAAPVIVPVALGICDGCHISIPPQSFIELQKGQQILNCPNCQRLIYWCEHFTPPVEG